MKRKCNEIEDTYISYGQDRKKGNLLKKCCYELFSKLTTHYRKLLQHFKVPLEMTHVTHNMRKRLSANFGDELPRT